MAFWTMPRTWLLACFTAVTASATVARAQTVFECIRIGEVEARATDGSEECKDVNKCWDAAWKALDAGDNYAAYVYFHAVYTRAPSPTSAVHMGEILENQGCLVEALERYRETIVLDLNALGLDDRTSPNARPAQERAQRVYDDLLKAVPTLSIAIEGVDAGDVAVRIDGRLITEPATPLRVNPGRRTITAQYLEQTRTEERTLQRGDRVKVVLKFDPPPPPPPPAPPPTSRPPPTNPAHKGSLATTTAAQSHRPSEGQRWAGYVALGVGGLGLAVGSILGVVAKSDEDKLKQACPNNECEPDHWDDVDRYSNKVTGFYVGMGVAGVGAVVGGLLFSVPLWSSHSPQAGLWLSTTPAGVRGRF